MTQSLHVPTQRWYQYRVVEERIHATSALGCKQASAYVGHVGEGDVVDVLGDGVCGQVGPAGQSLGAEGLQEALGGLQRHQLLALELGPGPTHIHGSDQGKGHALGWIHRCPAETLGRPAYAGACGCPGLQSSRAMFKYGDLNGWRGRCGWNKANTHCVMTACV